MVQTILQLTVRDILQRPLFLKAEAIASEEALNRTVHWVHIMEVTQVGHLLNGNELILNTGIGWHDNEELSLSFLQQLIDSGASGLCIELGTYTKQPLERMKQLAQCANFPLIFFHEQVRYIDITQDLHAYFIHQHHKMVSELYQTTPSPTPYLEEKLRFKQEIWLTDWLSDQHSQVEIRDYFHTLKSTLKLNQAIVCVFDSKSALHNLKNHDANIIHKQMVAIALFENEGFYLLPTVLHHQMVLILIDQLPTTPIQERIFKVIQRLPKTEMNQNPTVFSSLLGIGKPITNFARLQSSYESALETIAIQREVGPLRRPFYQELHIYKILHHLKQSGELGPLIEDYIGSLLSMDRERNSQLLKTLKVYLALNGSKQETAKALFIVRQTLYHRLDKIAALLGSDYMEPHKRITIELALHGYEYVNGMID
ncbi:hypothetical protein GCM10008018_68810 [Paenibacillus marchantiophytorum]|uniref:PucR family transcriptional regulator n=1 Tax=Paenibacillus marchantiophytorum TaxID=1619310 RepID=A0ABQ1FHY1_9BACL|nr:PucR family transcriptional regulator [Paenibacillus marchantiophytorum]GGA14125.1 hypothetical protein GCM10008018_68810 [Paenibacillus marchantiophytorum]